MYYRKYMYRGIFYIGDVNMDKTPPQNHDAERAIIGIMLNPAFLSEPIQAVYNSELSTDHFYSEKHQAIFSAMLELHEQRKPIDLITVTQQLVENGEDKIFDKINVEPAVYMDECVDCVPLFTPEQATQRVLGYVDIVKACAYRRSIINVARMAFNDRYSIKDVSAKLVEANEILDVPDAYKRERNVAINAFELQQMSVSEPEWIVRGYIPKGLTILAGKPKIGKSWLALALAVSVASGKKFLGSLDVSSSGDVLYLALEDNLMRLKSRINIVTQNNPAPEALECRLEFPKLDNGGLKQLEQWINDKQNPRLIIVDTLQRVRSKMSANSGVYADDYAVLEGMKSLSDRYSIGILVVHHLRKATADDPLDMVSGTTGLTGASDSTLIIQKQRSKADATMHRIGRDIEDESEVALKFDTLRAGWVLLGKADNHSLTQERQDIIEALKQSTEPMSPKEIADTLGTSSVNIRSLMARLAESGHIEKAQYGKYRIGLCT
jgi:hypothetical protein